MIPAAIAGVMRLASLSGLLLHGSIIRVPLTYCQKFVLLDFVVRLRIELEHGKEATEGSSGVLFEDGQEGRQKGGYG